MVGEILYLLSSDRLVSSSTWMGRNFRGRPIRKYPGLIEPSDGVVSKERRVDGY